MYMYMYMYMATIKKDDTSTLKYILSSHLKTYNLIHYKESKEGCPEN